MVRDRGIDPHHDNQVERKLEDHPRGGSADNSAVQRDVRAPPPCEVKIAKNAATASIIVKM
jgi:hypothetical protein